MFEFTVFRYLEVVEKPICLATIIERVVIRAYLPSQGGRGGSAGTIKRKPTAKAIPKHHAVALYYPTGDVKEILTDIDLLHQNAMHYQRVIGDKNDSLLEDGRLIATQFHSVLDELTVSEKKRQSASAPPTPVPAYAPPPPPPPTATTVEFSPTNTIAMVLKAIFMETLQLIKNHFLLSKVVSGPNQAAPKRILTSTPFLKAVDPVLYPDYATIISFPMNIREMEKKIQGNKYTTTLQTLGAGKPMQVSGEVLTSYASKASEASTGSVETISAAAECVWFFVRDMNLIRSNAHKYNTGTLLCVAAMRRE